MPFYTPLVTRFQPTRQHADSKKPYVSNGAWQRLIAEVLIRNPKKKQVMEIMHQLNIDVLSFPDIKINFCTKDS